ncbi:hypothetical protein ACJRO7_000968 [Eucalyptus globulus]|uniref:TF-B3 domain-containing protein n=1 Tax=Eucalyptus globulus TaxID=34317 RepID=A0ABD3LPJ0_EUCGL
MKSNPVCHVDDATISHAIGLASGGGHKKDDTELRIKNSKRKVSPTMPASRSSKSLWVITAFKATVPGRVLKGRINGRMQTLLYYPQHGSGKHPAGWGAFQRGTSLKEGDVCVFELVRIDNIELKVTIFKKNAKTSA